MLKRGFKTMLAEANAVIETVSVQDLAYHLEEVGALLLDVRETVECERNGVIPDSVHVPRGMLEFHADPESPAYMEALASDRPMILYCGTGGRSALAAKTLHDMGYANVASLAGGYQAWRLMETQGAS
jgi:rhodanese-related sulfurtransferase